jgi:hypothetical protein
MDEQQVWRFLLAQKIGLSGRKSWYERNPESATKAAQWPQRLRSAVKRRKAS